MTAQPPPMSSTKRVHRVRAHPTDESWDERFRWDGRFFISLATGKRTEHERLRRDHDGWFYLECWGLNPDQRYVTDAICIECAIDWLLRNGHALPQDLAGQDRAAIHLH